MILLGYIRLIVEMGGLAGSDFSSKAARALEASSFYLIFIPAYWIFLPSSSLSLTFAILKAMILALPTHRIHDVFLSADERGLRQLSDH